MFLTLNIYIKYEKIILKETKRKRLINIST